jgi:hypothetical protein
LVLSDNCTILFSIIQYIYFTEDGPTCFEPYMRFIFSDICFILLQPFFKGTCLVIHCKMLSLLYWLLKLMLKYVKNS